MTDSELTVVEPAEIAVVERQEIVDTTEVKPRYPRVSLTQPTSKRKVSPDATSTIPPGKYVISFGLEGVPDQYFDVLLIGVLAKPLAGRVMWPFDPQTGLRPKDMAGAPEPACASDDAVSPRDSYRGKVVQDHRIVKINNTYMKKPAIFIGDNSDWPEGQPLPKGLVINNAACETCPLSKWSQDFLLDSNGNVVIDPKTGRGKTKNSKSSGIPGPCNPTFSFPIYIFAGFDWRTDKKTNKQEVDNFIEFNIPALLRSTNPTTNTALVGNTKRIGITGLTMVVAGSGREDPLCVKYVDGVKRLHPIELGSSTRVSEYDPNRVSIEPTFKIAETPVEPEQDEWFYAARNAWLNRSESYAGYEDEVGYTVTEGETLEVNSTTEGLSAADVAALLNGNKSKQIPTNEPF